MMVIVEDDDDHYGPHDDDFVSYDEDPPNREGAIRVASWILVAAILVCLILAVTHHGIGYWPVMIASVALFIIRGGGRRERRRFEDWKAAHPDDEA